MTVLLTWDVKQQNKQTCLSWNIPMKHILLMMQKDVVLFNMYGEIYRYVLFDKINPRHMNIQ